MTMTIDVHPAGDSEQRAWRLSRFGKKKPTTKNQVQQPARDGTTSCLGQDLHQGGGCVQNPHQAGLQDFLPSRRGWS